MTIHKSIYCLLSDKTKSIVQKNKLFYLLNALSNTELRQLDKHFQHPFFQKNEKIVSLYQYLMANREKLRDGDYQHLKKEAAIKIYAKENSSGKIRSLMSSLYMQVEDFLLMKALRTDKKQRQDALLQLYRQRNLDRLLVSTIEQKKENLEKETPRDMDFHLAQLQLAHLRYYHPKTQQYKEKTPYENLIPLQENLDNFYILAKLRYSCEMRATQLIRGKKVEIPLLEEVMAYLKTANLENPLLSIYQKIFSLLETPEKKAYKKLRQEALVALPLFNQEGQHNLLLTLLNIAWFSMPTTQRAREFFDLNLIGMEKELLLENGLIAKANFNNFVDIGSSLKEFALVRKFVKKYSTHLDTDPLTRDNIGTLVEAFLLFGEEKFEEVPSVLNYLEYEDFSYGLRAHKLLIRSTYETKGAEGYREIELRCEAFKQYVLRKYKQHYLSKSIRDEQMNFIKIVQQLPFVSHSRFSRISKTEFLEKVKNIESLANKKWLVAKIEAI